MNATLLPSGPKKKTPVSSFWTASDVSLPTTHQRAMPFSIPSGT